MFRLPYVPCYSSLQRCFHVKDTVLKRTAIRIEDPGLQSYSYLKYQTVLHALGTLGPIKLYKKTRPNLLYKPANVELILRPYAFYTRSFSAFRSSALLIRDKNEACLLCRVTFFMCHSGFVDLNCEPVKSHTRWFSIVFFPKYGFKKKKQFIKNGRV